MPLDEKLPLDVVHMLDVADPDSVVETELHPEGDTVTDSVPLTVGDKEPVEQGVGEREALALRVPLPDSQAEGDRLGVCEPVPHDEPDSDSVPLGEKLTLDVEQMLGEVDADAVAESELHPEGDTDSDCVPLTVGVSDTVEQGVGDCEALIEGEREGDAVKHPEEDCEGELLALWLA